MESSLSENLLLSSRDMFQEDRDTASSKNSLVYHSLDNRSPLGIAHI